MRISLFTPVAFAAVSGGVGAPSDCTASIDSQDPTSLLQNSLKGSGKRSAEDDDTSFDEEPRAALLQTSSHTKAVLPMDFFNEDEAQPLFADDLSAKGVPNDVGRAAVPLYPDSVVKALPRIQTPVVEKGAPLALNQGFKGSSDQHIFFDGDDAALLVPPPAPVSLADAKDMALSSDVKARMLQQEQIANAEEQEQALAEEQTQKQLEEESDALAEYLTSDLSGGETVSVLPVLAQKVTDVGRPTLAPLRQPSSSSLDDLMAAQRAAAARLSGAAPELPRQKVKTVEEVPVPGPDEGQLLRVQLRDEQLALDEQLRGLELAQQLRQMQQPQQPQPQPEKLQQPHLAEPVAARSPPAALLGTSAALAGEVHSCQPGATGWPGCTSTQAFGPEHGSCTPQCTWQCDTPRCDEVCEPTCQPPRCETRCAAAATENCVMECDEPHCAVTCNRNQCPTHDCPSCISTCSEPMCKLRCPSAQPCRNVCEQPSCEWHCHAPEVCPEPTCHMVCEAPRSCQGNTYQQLPPLSPGELSVRSFAAPPLQDGVAQGSHVEGSVQNYDNQVTQGYTESQMRWPVQGYTPEAVPWPVAEAPVQWQAPNYAPEFEDHRAAPLPTTQAPQQRAVPEPQQEPSPTQVPAIEYREGYPHNLVLGAQ